MFYNGDCVTFTLYGVEMIGFVETVKENIKVALISLSNGKITAAEFNSLSLVKFPLMEEDYIVMMDFALDTKDKAWFTELSDNYTKLLQGDAI